MKKIAIFLTFNLLCLLSFSLPTHANSYWKDTYQVVSSTANYIVLRTCQSCKESGSYIREKVRGMGESISQWWHEHKPSNRVIVVYKE